MMKLTKLFVFVLKSITIITIEAFITSHHHRLLWLKSQEEKDKSQKFNILRTHSFKVPLWNLPITRDVYSCNFLLGTLGSELMSLVNLHLAIQGKFFDDL